MKCPECPVTDPIWDTTEAAEVTLPSLQSREIKGKGDMDCMTNIMGTQPLMSEDSCQYPLL